MANHRNLFNATLMDSPSKCSDGYYCPQGSFFPEIRHIKDFSQEKNNNIIARVEGISYYKASKGINSFKLSLAATTIAISFIPHCDFTYDYSLPTLRMMKITVFAKLMGIWNKKILGSHLM